MNELPDLLIPEAPGVGGVGLLVVGHVPAGLLQGRDDLFVGVVEEIRRAAGNIQPGLVRRFRVDLHHMEQIAVGAADGLAAGDALPVLWYR